MTRRQVDDITVVKKMFAKRGNAISRGITFDMTFVGMRNMLQATRCFYTGVPIEPAGAKGTRPNDLTIDRVDSSLGYITGNVVACSQEFNHLKGLLEHGNLDLAKKTLDAGPAHLRKGMSKYLRILDKTILKTSN